MSDSVNVSPDTRFDEATPDQFREFWERQGWKVDDINVVNFDATRRLPSGHWVDVSFLMTHAGELSMGFRVKWIRLDESIATFGEALRLANNLAQAELFGGWAE